MNPSPAMDPAAVSTEDESVLLVVHKHWVALLGDLALFVLAGVVVTAMLLVFRGAVETASDEIAHAIVTALVPLSLLILWSVLALVWTNYYLDMLVVTDRRLFYTAQSNFVQRTVRQWRITDILHADVRFESLLESFFNYGSLEITSRDDAEVTLVSGVPNPEYVSAIILKQDDRYGQLKETARKQEELLHFLSHEVKGHLAKSKAAFAAIVEGDYGQVSQPLQSLAGAALADTQKGVETVMSILEGSDLAHGTMTFEKKPFDLSEVLRRSFEEFRPAAERKGIALNLTVGGPCLVVGDEQKIAQHVVRNLLDNALRYTFAGQIDVALVKDGALARLSVADTGIGIAPNDMQKLFTQGGHGEHSRATNPDSTGYGLFVAKQVVEAHGGHISASSRGTGTGSTFSFELPLAAAVPLTA